MEEGPKAGA